MSETETDARSDSGQLIWFDWAIACAIRSEMNSAKGFLFPKESELRSDFNPL